MEPKKQMGDFVSTPDYGWQEYRTRGALLHAGR
jgi:hypothetical protein